MADQDTDALKSKLSAAKSRESLLERALGIVRDEERELRYGISRNDQGAESKVNVLESKEKGIENKVALWSAGNMLFIAAVLVIIALTVYFRSSLAGNFGFYEPDGFYHFSVIRAAVLHNFIVPKTLSISGWPQSTPVGEPVGLYWVTLFPYFFLRFVGISYYTIMRWIPVLFGIFDVLGAYLLSRYLSKDRLFGLMVMAFVALSMGDAARTTVTIYRGDGFAVIFLILSLVFTLQAMKENSKKSILYSVASGIVLSVSSLVWNGSSFGIAIFLFLYFLVLAYGFFGDDRSVIRRIKYILLSIFVWYLFAFSYVGNGLAPAQTFTQLTFIPIFIIMVLSWYIALYTVVKKRYGLGAKIGIAAFYSLVTLSLIFVALPGLINNIFVLNGFSTYHNTFATTIEELQPPSPPFLIASFGPTLFTNPMSILLYISSFFTSYKMLFLAIIVISMALYSYLKVTDSEDREAGGKAEFSFGLSYGMLCMLAYLFVTVFLQINAVRFNSLLSVPLAIFVAYTIFWELTILKNLKETDKREIIIMAAVLQQLLLAGVMISSIIQQPSLLPVTVIIAATAVSWFIMYTKRNSHHLTIIKIAAGEAILMAVIYAILQQPLTSSVVAAAAASFVLWAIIYAARESDKMTVIITALLQTTLFMAIIYGILQQSAPTYIPVLISLAYLAFWVLAYTRKYKNPNYRAALITLAAFFILLIIMDIQYSTGITPADNINPLFINALQWLKQNSPNNSVVLTLWPDGSVVEGVANRTSVTDSVGAQNPSKADPFARWIFNDSNDPQFLTSSISGRPDYLLVRYNWLYETQGIYTEAQFGNTVNQSQYGYTAFNRASLQYNATSVAITFINDVIGLAARTLMTKLTNGSTQITSYAMRNGQSGISPLSYVATYNQNTGAFSIVQQNGFNETNGQMLLLMFSSVPNGNYPINSTGAYMLEDRMGFSNMMKFLYFCNNQVCLWNDNNTVAHAELVYANPDTKIFKILYNPNQTVVR